MGGDGPSVVVSDTPGADVDVSGAGGIADGSAVLDEATGSNGMAELGSTTVHSSEKFRVPFAYLCCLSCRAVGTLGFFGGFQSISGRPDMKAHHASRSFLSGIDLRAVLWVGR